MMNIRNKSWLWLSIFWVLFFVYILKTPVYDFVNHKLSEPADFKIRHYLKKDPIISNRLKVIVLDDNSFARMDSWVLNLKQWYEFLAALEKGKPKQIFIDHRWSSVTDKGSQLKESIESLKSIRAKIIIGTPPYKGRVRQNELDFKWAQYDFDSHAREDYSDEDITPLLLKLKGSKKGYYTFPGPNKYVYEFISSIGHFSYDGNGEVSPILLGKEDIVPHVFMMTADSWSYSKDDLYVNNKPLNIDSRGYIPVNMPHPSLFKKSMKSFYWVYKNMKNNKISEWIKEGDTVVIIPLYFTGNTDFKMTPFGFIPAGLIPTSLINSVQTGEWLNRFSFMRELTVSFILFGTLVGLFIPFSFYFVVMVLALIGSFVLSQLLFSYYGIQIAWVWPMLGFFFASFSQYIIRVKEYDKKARSLKFALQKAVPIEKMEEVLKNPDRVDLTAKNMELTIMFIDIVQFSLLAESMSAEKVFDILKENLEKMTHIIHKHDGVVDKSMGDGLLCYFGYDFISGKSSASHTLDAVLAAIEIQKMTLSDETLLKFRIGINSEKCYIGNLGAAERIEYTVIGSGVNLAQRMEAACEPKKILMSASTCHLLIKDGFSKEKMREKEVRIKHRVDQIKVFEIDPESL